MGVHNSNTTKENENMQQTTKKDVEIDRDEQVDKEKVKDGDTHKNKEGIQSDAKEQETQQLDDEVDQLIKDTAVVHVNKDTVIVNDVKERKEIDIASKDSGQPNEA